MNTETEQASLMQAQMQIVREAPKICKDCKHYRLDGRQPAGSQHRCNRPIVDLVTGESKPHDARCEDERKGLGFCGIEAKFWEARV